MAMIKATSIFLCFCLLVASCSIEKRHYLPGYHVEWKQRQLQMMDKEDRSHQQNEDRFLEQENKMNNEMTENRECVSQNKVNPESFQSKNILSGESNTVNRQVFWKASDKSKKANIRFQKQWRAPEPDDKAQQDLAILDAEDAFLFGILSLLLIAFFFIASPILAQIAIKRGKRAIANYRGEDISVKRRAQQGLRMGQIALVISLVLIALIVIFIFALAFI